MFSSVLSLKPDKKITFFAKLFVFVGLVAYIGYVLRQQPFDWKTVQAQFKTVRYPAWWLAGLVGLMPVNWGLEALKWYILLQRVERTSYWSAFQGVLAGVALGFALPAQLGDTAGRVLSLRSGQRGAAIGASLVSGGMQFYVALVAGAIAWAYHLSTVANRNTTAGRWLFILLISLSAGGILLGLVRQKLVRWLSSRQGIDRWAIYWRVAGYYSDREIGLALIVALLRYCLFSVQFYLAMQAVGIRLQPATSASGIGLVFLVKTLTPAFNLLSDLGVREAASLWVFAPYGVQVPVMLTATLLLWLANILIPVLVGLIWVWKLRIRR
nr:lysylphosphatidylglycerol synthase domain-containing protein [Spirosoma panaciterrae]